MKQVKKEETIASSISSWSPNNKEAQGEGDKEEILADIVTRKDQKVTMDRGERH